MELFWKIIFLFHSGILFQSSHVSAQYQKEVVSTCRVLYRTIRCTDENVYFYKLNTYKLRLCVNSNLTDCYEHKLRRETFHYDQRSCRDYYYCDLEIINPEPVNVTPRSTQSCPENRANSTDPTTDTRGVEGPATQKRFVITADLPSSMVVGEKLLLKVNLENKYEASRTHNLNLTARVWISARGGFNISAENSFKGGINVPPNFVTSTELWLVPLEHGELELDIKADTGFFQDALLKRLRVRAGPVTKITKKVKKLKASGAEKDSDAIRSDPPREGRVLNTDIVISLSAEGAGMGSDEGNKEKLLASVDILAFNTLTSRFMVPVNRSNALQELFKFPGDFDAIYFAFGGVGSLVATVTWTHYLANVSYNSAFSIDVTACARDGMDKNVELTICERAPYIFREDDWSNKAVMEINLPSGYTVKDNQRDAFSHAPVFQRQKITEEGGKIEFFFQQTLASAQTMTCATVVATKNERLTIENLQPAYIKVYDFNEPNTKFAEKYYSVP